MSAIVIENLTKRYGQRLGIERLNLRVNQGEVFGFLGPNGAGKSTTIRLLLSLLRPTEGRATVFGLDCWRDGHRIKADIGYVPGDLRLYPWMTTRIAMQLFGDVRGRDLMNSGCELAERFELELDVKVRQMSRGMRQKLGLILALVHNPKLLILDEPTSALDPLMQHLLYDLLRGRASQGATVFFSSHTLSEVEDLCDRVAVLRKGRLVTDEKLSDMRNRAARVVSLQWTERSSEKSITPPPFLHVVSKKELRWECTLDGDVMELVRWASDKPLEDMTVSPPDLDSVFRSYYEQPNPPATGGAS